MQRKSLRSRIFRMNVVLVLAAVLLFAAYGIARVQRFAALNEQTNMAQNEVIIGTVADSMLEMTEANFRAYVKAEARVIDGEFWTMKHDLEILASQVREVLEGAEYTPSAPIQPPDPSRAGQLTLQLLYSRKADPRNPALREQIERISGLDEMMMEIVEGGNTLTDCIVSLVGGASIAVDNMPQMKVDDEGKPLYFEPDTRPWYIGAVAHGNRVWFSPVSRDNFYDEYEVMAGILVYVNNKLAAVCGGSIRMRELSDIIASSRLGENSDTCLINENGVLIYSSRTEGELGMTYDKLKRLRSAGNTELVQLVNSALEGNSGFTLLDLDGEPTYIAYAPLETVGWTQLLMISLDEMSRPAFTVIDRTDEVMMETIQKARDHRWQLVASTVMIVLILIVLSVTLSMNFAKRLVRPINHMTRKVSEMEGQDMTFHMDPEIETGDEIEILGRAFENMSGKLRGYVSEIIRITAEKQRMDTELSVAADIQSNMLPSHFPAFPDRKEFDLYAVMDPAKEVGGDFYDFFFIDRDHLALVMADVSGKGVPAALFMVISKTLIKNAAMTGQDKGPGEILRDVNNQLCEGNEDNMFVTVWLGILDLRDGSMVSACAGHEYPVFYREGRGFIMEKDAHGLAMGAMENVRFRETRWKMDPGDLLFLYTDGVPEATSITQELFGNDRMLAALEESMVISRKAGTAGKPDLKTLLWNVRQKVDTFAGDAPQFDDLTMMGIAYYGNGSDGKTAG